MANDIARIMQSGYSEGRRLSGAGKERKNFSVQTRKKVWMKAGGHNPDNWRKAQNYTSKCMQCGKKLTWGNRCYEFDHRYNDQSNNRISNCGLLCLDCHRKDTVLKKRRVSRFGLNVGHATYKKKVGYKKTKPTKQRAKHKRRPNLNSLINPRFY